MDLAATEATLSEFIKKSTITSEDANKIGYLLSSIVTKFFSSLENDTNMKGWSVDDMYPSDVRVFSKKLTLIGKINWLHGGEKCEYYQADIATDTSPILYSIKLKDKHENQRLYIAKTFTGWVLNTT